MLSQPILAQEKRVKVIITNKDTILQMKVSDARLVLVDLLDKNILDSLVSLYDTKDKIKNKTMFLQTSEIIKLQQKSANEAMQKANLEKVVINKNTEIADLTKEVTRQKRLKVLAMIGDVVLPIVTIFLLHL